MQMNEFELHEKEVNFQMKSLTRRSFFRQKRNAKMAYPVFHILISFYSWG